MPTQYGFLLFIIGTAMTVIVMAIALYVGSKPVKKEEELNEVQKSIQKLNKGL